MSQAPAPLVFPAVNVAALVARSRPADLVASADAEGPTVAADRAVPVDLEAADRSGTPGFRRRPAARSGHLAVKTKKSAGRPGPA